MKRLTIYRIVLSIFYVPAAAMTIYQIVWLLRVVFTDAPYSLHLEIAALSVHVAPIVLFLFAMVHAVPEACGDDECCSGTSCSCCSKDERRVSEDERRVPEDERRVSEEEERYCHPFVHYLVLGYWVFANLVAATILTVALRFSPPPTNEFCTTDDDLSCRVYPSQICANYAEIDPTCLKTTVACYIGFPAAFLSFVALWIVRKRDKKQPETRNSDVELTARRGITTQPRERRAMNALAESEVAWNPLFLKAHDPVPGAHHPLGHESQVDYPVFPPASWAKGMPAKYVPRAGREQWERIPL